MLPSGSIVGTSRYDRVQYSPYVDIPIFLSSPAPPTPTTNASIWTDDPLAVNNARVLVRMVNKAGSPYTEEQLEAGGTWSQKQIYCMKNYSDILGVDSELVDI